MTSTPRGVMHRKKDTFQYIPLEKSLKALLKNKEVCDEVSLFATCRVRLFITDRLRHLG